MILEIILIIYKGKCLRKILWQILADFVADSVAESTKTLDYQEVSEANARCGRDSITSININDFNSTEFI